MDKRERELKREVSEAYSNYVKAQKKVGICGARHGINSFKYDKTMSKLDSARFSYETAVARLQAYHKEIGVIQENESEHNC